MSTDYFDAATRHQKDASLLFENKRWPNADQLYGLAAECALKAIMQALGMPLWDDGAPKERKHRRHIDRLWNEFLTFANGKAGATIVRALPADNPFDDWCIAQRYQPSSAILPERVAAHKEAASQVFVGLENARAEGRLSCRTS
jgi:hypothetical protein